MRMLGHVPDICWTGAGWKPFDLGQPQQILIDIPIAQEDTSESRSQTPDVRDQTSSASNENAGPIYDIRSPISGKPLEARLSVSHLPSPVSHAIPFETRTFILPESGEMEHVAWCVVIGGKPLSESAHLNGRFGNVLSSMNTARIVRLGQLWQAIQDRFAVRSENRFVRFSVPATDDRDLAESRLNTIASQWLRTRS